MGVPVGGVAPHDDGVRVVVEQGEDHVGHRGPPRVVRNPPPPPPTGAAMPPQAMGASIYFEAGSGYFAAGEASYIGETLKRLGLRNVVGPTMGAFPQVNPEFVVKANPQIIFLGERAATDLQNRPGWHRIEALQNQRVCSFTPAQSDIVVRSGPRIAEAAELMVDCLQRMYSQ